MKLEAADLESLRPLLRTFATELLAEFTSMQTPATTDDNGAIRIAFREGEVAAMIGVATHVLREQRKLGKIEYCKGPGRRILYTKDQIEAYLRRTA